MRAEKLKIIKNVLGRGYQSGEEHLFSCPFCGHHKKKMSVNVDKSVFKCWICDKSGRDLGYIVRKFGTREDRDEWVIIGLVGQVKVLKGEVVNDRWIKMRDVSDTVEEYFIR